MSQPHPPSPCVRVCTLDAASNVCVGCWRSTTEIAEWSSMSAERKRDVLVLTEQRKAERREEMHARRRRRMAARRGA